MESCEYHARYHDKSIATRGSNEPRECCRSRDDSRNLKTCCSRLSLHASDCPDFRGRSKEREQEERDGKTVKTRPISCYDKFALAKRLHAENLQHQPLPDKVDDRIFSNVKPAHGHHPASCDAKCRDDVPTLEQRFGPALGCKKPKTRMDLAICWETPIDPVYEPRRSTHIDDSEGGSAPAIFALIQHTPAPKNHELLARTRNENDKCDCAKRKTDSKARDRCCCEYLCNGMKAVAVRDDIERRHDERTRPMQRITERKCAACEAATEDIEKKQRDPRLIRSAVGVALGLQKRCDVDRRNGLPSAKITVPRPRTPFARRSFCIDTLAPPFSVVNGCRDADYPEHWRLMSVYQQSYRNPERRKACHL